MKALTGLLEHANVQDSWEAYNSTFLDNKSVFTWRQGGPFSTSTTQSRLDRIYISDLIARNVIHATVQETVVSDHMIYEIHIMTPEEHRRYLPDGSSITNYWKKRSLNQAQQNHDTYP